MEKERLKALVEKLGDKYSDVLGIALSSKHDEEIFKWFLAAVLFGAPITETSVVRTYKCFEKRDVLSPNKILETGWNGLVEILDEGGYTRYDFKTADKLLEVMKNLKAKYGGSLNNLHDEAKDALDLEKRLKDLGKGIGDVTVSIFLRDLRGVWHKADPKPTPLVILAAKKLGITKTDDPKQALKELKAFWRKNKISGKSFVNFETALLRFGKDLRRKEREDSKSAKQGFNRSQLFSLGRSLVITSTGQPRGKLIFFCHSLPIAMSANTPEISALALWTRLTRAACVSPVLIMSSTMRMLSLLLIAFFGR